MPFDIFDGRFGKLEAIPLPIPSFGLPCEFRCTRAAELLFYDDRGMPWLICEHHWATWGDLTMGTQLMPVLRIEPDRWGGEFPVHPSKPLYLAFGQGIATVVVGEKDPREALRRGA